MKTIVTRRHFIVSGATALGACFLPASLLRRARDYQLNTNQVLLEGPTRPEHTLYATDRGDGRWILALDSTTEESPPAPTWRVWLSEHEGIDPADRSRLAEWIWENRHEVSGPSRDWLDSEISYRRWESYLEGGFAVNDSPEAQALSYLHRIKLTNGPVTDGSGQDVGCVHFYHGTSPGADWHFVEVEGELILPALQHRLRELGEETQITVITT